MCCVRSERHCEWCHHKCVACTRIALAVLRWRIFAGGGIVQWLMIAKYYQIFLSPVFSMFTDNLVATDISGYVTVTYRLRHSLQWWANHIVFKLISIERLNSVVLKWSNSTSRLSHLVFQMGQWSAIEAYQISCIKGNVHCFEEGNA